MATQKDIYGSLPKEQTIAPEQKPNDLIEQPNLPQEQTITPELPKNQMQVPVSIPTTSLTSLPSTNLNTVPTDAPTKEIKKDTITVKDFGYATTPEQREQRNTIIASSLFNANKKFDENQVRNTIKQFAPGVTDADILNTVKEIKGKYDTFAKNKQIGTKLGALSAGDLAKTNLSTDEINYLQTNDPNKYAEYNKAKDIQTTNDLLTGKKVEEPKTETPVIPTFDIPTIDLTKIRNDLYGTEEFKKAKSTVSEYKLKLDDIQDQVNSVLLEVEKQFAGTGATRGEIARRANKEIEELTEQYKTIKKQYDVALSDYTLLKDDADLQYKSTLEQYDINRQSMQDKLNIFNMQYGIYRDEINDKAAVLKADKEFERQKEILGIQSKIQSERDYNLYLQDLDKMEIDNKYKENANVQSFKQDIAKMGLANSYDIDKDKLNFEQQKQLAQIENKYAKDRDVQNYLLDRQKLQYSYENDPANIEKRLDMIDTYGDGVLSILGNGKITGYGGAYDNNRGLDVDGKIGDAIYGFSGTVITSGSDKTAGNYMKVKLDDGSTIMFSHLNKTFKVGGERITPQDIIAEVGNTGRVIPGKGGDGSHIDIRMTGKDGKPIYSGDIETYLKNYNPIATKDLTSRQMLLIDDLKGDTYSPEARKLLNRAGITDQQVTDYLNIKSQASKGLSDDQRVIWNSLRSGFQSNKSVQAFENAMLESGKLIESLNSASGPGDVAGIFNFMKTLDPNSTVREGEFALAEQSAGIVAKGLNTWTKLVEGGRLTDDQRKDFAKLSKAYIGIMAKQYNRLYNDMQRVADNEKIPRSYLPTNATKDLQDELGMPIGVQDGEDYILNLYGASTNNVGDNNLELNYFTQLGY